MEDSEPVGSASLVLSDMDTRRDLSPWLGSIYVLRAFRRRGIVTALVSHALARAREFGVERLYLWADSAASLYERLGFGRAPELDMQPAPGVTIKGYRLGLEAPAS